MTPQLSCDAWDNSTEGQHVLYFLQSYNVTVHFTAIATFHSLKTISAIHEMCGYKIGLHLCRTTH